MQKAVGVQVRHAMTRVVLVASPRETLEEAAVRLRDNEISGLPVVEADGRVTGVLSEKDIARELSEVNGADRQTNLEEIHGAPNRHPMLFWEMSSQCLRSLTVAQAMTRDPVVITPDASLDVAARVMIERKINRLPVVDGGKLVGILTRHDVLSALI